MMRLATLIANLTLSVAPAAAQESISQFDALCVVGGLEEEQLPSALTSASFDLEENAGSRTDQRQVWAYVENGTVRNRVVHWHDTALETPARLCMFIAFGNWQDEYATFMSRYQLSPNDVPPGFLGDGQADFWRKGWPEGDVYLEFRVSDKSNPTGTFAMTVGRLKE